MRNTRRYCYGPWLSRRLGSSLGVDILPKMKKCTYNCVYCEIGSTQPDHLVPPDYRIKDPPTQNFRKELHSFLKYTTHLNSITFGYNGEPTLNENILDFLRLAKELRNEKNWPKKYPQLTLFTNSSTLFLKEIREKIKNFDLVLAKLDVANEIDFRRVNCPHKDVPNIDIIIDSLVKLKREMPNDHKLAIQCLIFNSNREKFTDNNTSENINDLAFAFKKIKPDIVQVYSIARMPAKYYVYAIDDERKAWIVQEFKQVIDDESVDIRYF